MIEDFIKEINELNEYKRKYECAIKDKQVMSDKLYDLYLEKYNSQTFEERKLIHLNDSCKCCRYNCDCDQRMLPENILMPLRSDKGWLPPRVTCSEFAWD